MRRAVLMCAGEYEPVPIQASGTAGGEKRIGSPLIVAVDGGLPRLLQQGIEPDLVLGDFDSLDPAFGPYLDRLQEHDPDSLRRLPCEKDDTDTVYAARLCLEQGCRELLFYGALGGRLDHTFANVQTLAWLKKEGALGYLMGKKTLAAVIGSEKVLLPVGYEGTFSLFALDTEVTGVTLEGMKYPLSDAVLTNSFPLGVSNEIHPETVLKTQHGRACVTVRTGLALMILEKSAGARGSEESGMPDPSLIERIPL